METKWKAGDTVYWYDTGPQRVIHKGVIVEPPHNGTPLATVAENGIRSKEFAWVLFRTKREARKAYVVSRLRYLNDRLFQISREQEALKDEGFRLTAEFVELTAIQNGVLKWIDLKPAKGKK